MDTTQIVVTAGGLLTVGFILWFFFGPKASLAAHVSEAGVQEVEVRVRGGYTPDRIEVKRGKPVRLSFLREESSPCTEQVILGEFGIARQLPQGVPVDIEFTPEKTGEFPFHCGMNMVRGTLVVTP